MTLCSECFRNEGLRIEAEKLGRVDNTSCEHCHSTVGRKLSKDLLETLVEKFFVHGSVPQNIGGYSSVYKVNGDPKMESVSFPEPLQTDYETIKSSLGIVLFHYGPPLWRVGLTDHYLGLCEAMAKPTEEEQMLAAQPILEEIICHCNVLVMPIGTKLYRVRVNIPSDQYAPLQYDTVPDHFKTDETCARFDTRALPVFYAAPDVETCLHECRVTAADEIYLATMETTKELLLLNIGDDFIQPDGNSPFERVAITMNKLCTTNKDEYPKCRLVSKAIKAAGYDGFKFKSYFSIVKETSLFNFALFGHPVASGNLQLNALNRVKLEGVDYAYSFGPLFEETIK